MMAKVKLTSVWLSAAVDNADTCEFVSMPDDLSLSTSVQGENMELAGGDTIPLRREGSKQVLSSVVLPIVTDDQIKWLRDHLGEEVWWRDQQGNKLAGTYYSMGLSYRRPYSKLRFVTITIESTTVSEVV